MQQRYFNLFAYFTIEIVLVLIFGSYFLFHRSFRGFVISCSFFFSQHIAFSSRVESAETFNKRDGCSIGATDLTNRLHFPLMLNCMVSGVSAFLQYGLQRCNNKLCQCQRSSDFILITLFLEWVILGTG